MKSFELKRLKAGLLAGVLCLSLGACSKDEEAEKEEVEIASVFFVQGKALIYSGEEPVLFEENYVGIGGTAIKYTSNTYFSDGIEAIKVQSKEDAIELATAIVGEDNIIYIDYEDKDMIFTYKKGE